MYMLTWLECITHWMPWRYLQIFMNDGQSLTWWTQSDWAASVWDACGSDLFDCPTVQKYSSCLRRSFLKAPKLRRSSRFVAVSCGRRHFLDSLKGDVCVFSPLCSQLVNISSEIKWLRRLQHVFDSPFDSSSPYADGKSGSQSTHIFCVSLSEFLSFAKMVLVGQRWCFSIVKPLFY